MSVARTHSCGELRREDAGRTVSLAGWVHRRRDHGGVVFIDLRDRGGIVQLVFHPEVAGGAFAAAQELRSEYVIAVEGEVRARPAGTVNPQLPTGEVEVYPARLAVINPAKTPPIYVADGGEAVDETVRLRYRYLDLRRPELQQNLILRHRAIKVVRDFFDARGFLEIETPFLTRSTPEGARDFLVPSRLQRGKWYALPQSPQLFKQLLMVAGLERYVQVVRCFRDEDLRADRQPEFTQIDVEMSFVDRDDVMALVEEMVAEVWERVLGRRPATPFPRLPYEEAMGRYGSDKPDLRFGLELADLSDLVAGSGFSVFRDAVAGGGRVMGLLAPGCGGYSRSQIDELGRLAQTHGARGLAWIALAAGEVRSPIAKFLSPGELAAIRGRMGAADGDLLLFVADARDTAAGALGALRLEFGRRLGLADPGAERFLWVVDFPLLEYSQEEGRFVARHHPFTAPLDEDAGLLEGAPARVRAKAYDLVLNGVEIGGGSIRIHRRDLQERVFAALGIGEAEAREKFGFLLEAFEYGAPPHGGIAFGLDRLVMLMAGAASLREVIAFPKTASGGDPLTGAPAEVSDEQLRELGIKPFGGRDAS